MPERMKVIALALLLAATAFALAPVADAGPDCYEIYSEHHVGPVTIIQRSSCSYEVRCDDPDVCGLQ